MRAIADSATWLALTCSPDGMITSLSPTAEQLTGYSAQDLVGRPVTHILADRTTFEVAQMMESARQWGFWDGEVVYRNRSGKALDARGSLSVLSGRENELFGFSLVSVVSNAADTGGACEASLDEVAGRLRTFSHELNNPLAVIMGFTQLIMMQSNCTGKFRTDMERLYSELARVSQVVEKLHKYAVSIQRDDRYPSNDVEQSRSLLVRSS